MGGLLVNDPASQKALSDVLFTGNNQARLIAQRTLRLGLLPKPPEPPAVKVTVFNPVDQFIVAKWEQAGLKGSRCSSDGVRRRGVSSGAFTWM